MKTIPLMRLAEGDVVSRIGDTVVEPPSEVLTISRSPLPLDTTVTEMGVLLEGERSIYIYSKEPVTADVLDPQEMMFNRRRRKWIL